MRGKLIDAALHQYSLHGYYGATMKKIATEVGIKPASIYFFYKNKKALFIAAFQYLLDNHQNKLEKTLNENKDKPVNQIFTAMLHGIVSHHKGDLQSTNAYISLVTSPIPDITKHLSKHMLELNDWLVKSLESTLKKKYPRMLQDDVDRVIKQWVIIGNGIFWGIQLYEGKELSEQVDLADQMIHTLFLELEKKFKQ